MTKRRKPYTPIFRPAKKTAIPIGPSSNAAGIQEWNGNIGALTANAKANRKNTMVWVPVGTATSMRTSRSNDSSPPDPGASR